MHIHVLGIIGLQHKEVRLKKGTWCRWVRPSRGRYKLNVDGSARNGEITGGEVIRDEHGNLVASFSHYYGQGTIMRVEFTALLDGLSLCNAMELWELDMECRSKVVVTQPCWTKEHQAGLTSRYLVDAWLVGGTILVYDIFFLKLTQWPIHLRIWLTLTSHGLNISLSWISRLPIVGLFSRIE